MADIKTYQLKKETITGLLMFLKEDLKNYDKIKLIHNENWINYYILDGGKRLVFDQKNLELIAVNASTRLKNELGWVINGGC